MKTDEEVLNNFEFLYLLKKMGKIPDELIEQWELFNEKKGLEKHMNSCYGFSDNEQANITFALIMVLLTKYGIKEFDKEERKSMKTLAIKCFEILNDYPW